MTDELATEASAEALDAAVEPSAAVERSPAVEPSAAGRAEDAVAPRAPDPAVAAPVAPPAPLAAPTPDFVYALGQIDIRFPSLSIEKEFAQATGTPDNAGRNDRQALKAAIGETQNRYLARNLCWVLEIENLETYILVPRDPVDLDLFMDAYREDPRRDDLDVVIGVRTQIAPPEMCNGLSLPVVVVDQLYSFDRETLIERIPPPEGLPGKQVGKFRTAAGLLFDDLTQLADNAGATDAHRAINYLTVRYPRIYTVTSEQHDRNFAFTGVEVLRSPVSDVRSLVDVVFSYRHRETDVAEKKFVRVDVTEEFPFLAKKMSPYYDR
jgi:cyclic patellamide precursor peptide PatG